MRLTPFASARRLLTVIVTVTISATSQTTAQPSDGYTVRRQTKVIQHEWRSVCCCWGSSLPLLIDYYCITIRVVCAPRFEMTRSSNDVMVHPPSSTV
ncbi:unnamed protein product [Soboliphyme baturini]|uniref:Secreted protein n=1 Tax=Soboliphyme baturini TaxID=241478 RepID=A0A183J113_9BILA|nr:unnamed protein product [Soboliphyme baturini]